MNRRKFSSMLIAGTSMLGMPVVLAGVAGRDRALMPSEGWESLDQCQAMVGQCFTVEGWPDARFELTRVVPYSAASSRQFFARFSTGEAYPEGLYLLKHLRHSRVLFMQPVYGQPGVMESAFNLDTI